MLCSSRNVGKYVVKALGFVMRGIVIDKTIIPKAVFHV